jgi:hypothetical protein
VCVAGHAVVRFAHTTYCYQGEFQTDPREALRQAQLASGSSSDGRSWRVGLLTVAVTSAVIRAD